jgi:hypothetical protein
LSNTSYRSTRPKHVIKSSYFDDMAYNTGHRLRGVPLAYGNPLATGRGGETMKRVISLLTICLLVTFVGVSTSTAMGRAKKTDKPACSCPEGKCTCTKADAPKTPPCGCPEGQCKCATKK